MSSLVPVAETGYVLRSPPPVKRSAADCIKVRSGTRLDGYSGDVYNATTGELLRRGWDDSALHERRSLGKRAMSGMKMIMYSHTGCNRNDTKSYVNNMVVNQCYNLVDSSEMFPMDIHMQSAALKNSTAGAVWVAFDRDGDELCGIAKASSYISPGCKDNLDAAGAKVIPLPYTRVEEKRIVGCIEPPRLGVN
jgi:hypothetical protein